MEIGLFIKHMGKDNNTVKENIELSGQRKKVILRAIQILNDLLKPEDEIEIIIRDII